MRFSSNFGTAIHTLLIIGECSKTQRITSKVIADRLGTSPVLVRNLITILQEAGLLTVAPNNSRAGTTLAKPLDQITLYDLFCVIEPNHAKELTDTTTRLAKRSHIGLYANQIIAGYVEKALGAAKNELEKITLADTLDDLLKKEAESPYDDPRALFPKSDNKTT